MKIWILFFLMIGLFTGTSVWSGERAELLLWKGAPDNLGTCSHCADNLSVWGGQDRADFSEWPNYIAEGVYYFDLQGPVGTTITLFGNTDFKTQMGFLILHKQDLK